MCAALGEESGSRSSANEPQSGDRDAKYGAAATLTKFKVTLCGEISIFMFLPRKQIVGVVHDFEDLLVRGL